MFKTQHKYRMSLRTCNIYTVVEMLTKISRGVMKVLRNRIECSNIFDSTQALMHCEKGIFKFLDLETAENIAKKSSHQAYAIGKK